MSKNATKNLTGAHPDEVIEQKAAELSKVYNCAVWGAAFKLKPDAADTVVGYFKEPGRQAKFAVMDKANMGAISAASELVDVYLIKEESDPRILSDDAYYMAASLEFLSRIQIATNIIKKKIADFDITEDSDALTQWMALIQYHFKVDPSNLDDETLGLYIARLKFALQKTGQWKD